MPTVDSEGDEPADDTPVRDALRRYQQRHPDRAAELFAQALDDYLPRHLSHSDDSPPPQQ